MTDATPSTARAIGDARALLAEMLTKGWRQIHVRSGDAEFFITSDGGRANPLGRPGQGSLGVSSARHLIVAPHVATLVSVLAPGANVAAGEPLAMLELLGTNIPIIAEQAGRVDEVYLMSGDLVEFGMPVLTVVAAGKLS